MQGPRSTIEHIALNRDFFTKSYIYIYINTVDLLILARYRDRTVSVTKLWPQISHPYHTLSTVP
jgi:hypothetical protein